MKFNSEIDFQSVEPYSSFAKVYDATMAEVDYNKWYKKTLAILQKYKIEPDAVIADLGCGTGIVLKKLQQHYRNIIGVDHSAQMLEKASLIFDGRLVQADICQLPFNDQSFDALFSQHDTVNYLTSLEQLRHHFSEVARVLKPDGIYLADISSERNVLQNFADKTFHEKHGNIQFVWTNSYDKHSKVVESTLEFTDKKKKIKHREIHRQKIYSPNEVLTIAGENQLYCVEKFSDYEDFEKKDAQLQVFVFQKKEKF